MAFDGITVASLQFELKQALEGGRISKIAQPEADELLLGSLTPQNPQSLTGSYFFVIFVYLIDRNAVLCYNTLYTEEVP